MNTFFTSDTHFGHTNIIHYCKRPFAHADEMDETLITRWNAKVRPGDLVYHLGDFAMGRNPREAENIRRRLNGNIALINGNHETVAQSIPHCFAWQKDYYEAKAGEQKIILFHYPLRSWHHNMRGTWHLFGHCHGGVKGFGKSFDIGVDCWDFAPLSFEEVSQEMTKREREHEEGFSCQNCKKFPCECK